MQGQVHTCEEEGVMRIPGGMLLWLEQGIEIPETAQEETCLGSMYLVHSCWHLLIPNLPGSITLSILGDVERFKCSALVSYATLKLAQQLSLRAITLSMVLGN